MQRLVQEEQLARRRLRAAHLVETLAGAIAVLDVPVSLERRGGAMVLTLDFWNPSDPCADAGGQDIALAAQPIEMAGSDPFKAATPIAQAQASAVDEDPAPEAGTDDVEVEPESANAAADSAPVPGPLALPESAPVILKVVQAHLNALGYISPWCPQTDHQLIARLTDGLKLPAVAQELGIPVDDCRKRFSALCPQTDWDAQLRLLRVLGCRAGLKQPVSDEA
ncbi:hypothetical protein [Pseudooceanicola algae]|uniref:Uncharacterized protein n=1 Tax=Pseudooceanicola algae TaxID=1537215 RepID=A0A418SK66_9RHOB|nr:hypothetical protein [Pseudooceanicola algae]QPM89140.1 hypothetical protein PSAL_003510 [Pseudooceanicola algae]